MGQMRVRRTGPWVKISCPFSWVQFIPRVGQGVGQQLTHILARTIFGVFATKKHRKPKFSMLFGAGGVTRTHDLLITNQLLYRLSYTSASIQMRVRVYHKVFYSSSNFPNFLKAAAKPSLPPLFHFLRRLRRMRLMWRSKSPLPMSSASTYCSKTGTVQE